MFFGLLEGWVCANSGGEGEGMRRLEQLKAFGAGRVAIRWGDAQISWEVVRIAVRRLRGGEVHPGFGEKYYVPILWRGELWE